MVAMLILLHFDKAPVQLHQALHAAGYAQHSGEMRLLPIFPFHGPNLCEANGLTPRAGGPARVFDAMLFNRELDMLELRMAELQHVVTKHVIVEGTRSWTGAPKRMWFNESRLEPRFAQHATRVAWQQFDPPTHSAWGAEAAARRIGLYNALRAAGIRDGDVVLMGDADEIPRADVVEVLAKCDGWPDIVSLAMRSYYISFEFRNQLPWQVFKAFKWLPEFAHNLQQVRSYGAPSIYDAGWHCSYCFEDPADLLNKLESNAHTNANEPVRRYYASNMDVLRAAYCEERDVLKGAAQMGIKVERSAAGLPEFILSNPKRFRHLLPGTCANV